jgi:hypothetical protein
LGLVTSFKGDETLPSISSDFSLNWLFNSAKADDPNVPTTFGSTPTIAFNNVKLDLGTFFSKFAGPILGKVQKITEPVAPILDILTKPIPIGLNPPITLLKIARETTIDGEPVIDQEDEDLIESLVEIRKIVESIKTTSNIQIDLGSFNLNNAANADVRTEGFNLSNVELNEEKDITTAKALDEQLSGNDKEKERGLITTLSTLPGAGLEFPILTNPTNVFNLLLGKPVDLFTYDLPKLQFNLGYESPLFPIIGPLGARIIGEFGAGVDLAFGFDTDG